jgi:hypothetical protein
VGVGHTEVATAHEPLPMPPTAVRLGRTSVWLANARAAMAYEPMMLARTAARLVDLTVRSRTGTCSSKASSSAQT